MTGEIVVVEERRTRDVHVPVSATPIVNGASLEPGDVLFEGERVRMTAMRVCWAAKHRRPAPHPLFEEVDVRVEDPFTGEEKPVTVFVERSA